MSYRSNFSFAAQRLFLVAHLIRGISSMVLYEHHLVKFPNHVSLLKHHGNLNNRSLVAARKND